MNRLKVASIAISAVSLAVSLFMWAKESGFKYGFFYGVFSKPTPTPISFGGGYNHFQSLNIWYFSIVLILCVNIAIKFFRYTTVGCGVCILLLTFLIVRGWEMDSDWFFICAIAALLIIEVAIMRLSYVVSETIEIKL